MLSSSKCKALFLFLLLPALSVPSAAFQIREVEETTTATGNQTPTQPSPDMTKATKKPVTDNTPSQPKDGDYAKNVKIVFPTKNDSEEESKFDVYGWKTTPAPGEKKQKKVEKSGNVNTTSEATVMETTTIASVTAGIGNITDSEKVQSLDDRLGILNLPPRCPKGQVIFNQRCHKTA